MDGYKVFVAYEPSEAFIRSEWTGETIEQAQAAINAGMAGSSVAAGDYVIARQPVRFGRRPTDQS